MATRSDISSKRSRPRLGTSRPRHEPGRVFADSFVTTLLRCIRSLASRMKLILADLVEELAAADAELLGGLGAVAAAGEQGTLDRTPLDLGQQGSQGHGVGSRRRRP